MPDTKIKLRRGNASVWQAVNPILDPGEPGVELDQVPPALKVGDGATPWNSLPYSLSQAAMLAYIDNQILGLRQEVAQSVQSARDYAVQRANHTGFDPASAVKFAAGETLESLKQAFLQQTQGAISGAPVVATPSFSGTLSVGSTLTATPGSVTEGTGGAHTNLYQWYRVSPTQAITAIAGATNTTYVLTANDNGYFMLFSQQAVDTVTGIPSIIKFAAVSASTVGGTVPSNSVLPSISPTGSAVAGSQAYTIGAGTWTGSPTNYNYSIRVDGVQVGASVNSASNSISYTPNVAGPFGALTVSVVATNANGTSAASVSTSSVTITAPVSPPTDGYVEITSSMWAEIVAEAANNGDPNAAGYEARVNAMSSAGCTVLAPGGNIATALSAASVGVVLQDGNYTLAQGLVLGTKRLLVQDGARAVVDCATVPQSAILVSMNSSGGGQLGAAGAGVLEFRNINNLGVIAWGAAQNYVIRHLVVDGGTGVSDGGPGGISLQQDATNCIAVSCAVKNVRDSSGGNSDAYSMRYNVAANARNALIGCYGYRASDDGVDAWDSKTSQYLYFCNMEQMGKNAVGNQGNGNGYKGGSSNSTAVMHYYKCVSNDNKSFGWNRNGNSQVPRLKACSQIGDDAGPFAGGVGLYNIIA